MKTQKQSLSTSLFPYLTLSSIFQRKYKKELLFKQIMSDNQLLIIVIEFLNLRDIFTLCLINKFLNQRFHKNSKIELMMLRVKVSHYENKQKKMTNQVFNEISDKKDFAYEKIKRTAFNVKPKIKQPKTSQSEKKFKLYKQESLKGGLNIQQGQREIDAFREKQDLKMKNKARFTYVFDFQKKYRPQPKQQDGNLSVMMKKFKKLWQ